MVFQALTCSTTWMCSTTARSRPSRSKKMSKAEAEKIAMEHLTSGLESSHRRRGPPYPVAKSSAYHRASLCITADYAEPDEPTSALDPDVGEVLEVIKVLAADGIMVVVTHEMAFARNRVRPRGLYGQGRGASRRRALAELFGNP